MTEKFKDLTSKMSKPNMVLTEIQKTILYKLEKVNYEKVMEKKFQKF